MMALAVVRPSLGKDLTFRASGYSNPKLEVLSRCIDIAEEFT